MKTPSILVDCVFRVTGAKDKDTIGMLAALRTLGNEFRQSFVRGQDTSLIDAGINFLGDG